MGSFKRMMYLDILICLLGFLPIVSSFTSSPINRKPSVQVTTSQVFSSRPPRNIRDKEKPDYLFENFKTASGEILNPYRVLKVSRKADRKEIRKAYIALSRKYHPDAAQFRDILPGKCNDFDDVREEWERIKLSYEILTDKKLRLRYDRNTAIADPGAAVGRAALDALGWGFSSVGKGILGAGKMALDQMKKD